MMLKYSFGLTQESAVIERAVDAVLQSGVRTLDIKDDGTKEVVGTQKMGELVCREIGK
jgi:3-isopropylmalate dehydrogenase